MDFTVRTDLACECMEKGPSALTEGVYKEEQIGDVKICRLQIPTMKAAEEIGKPVGSYVTFQCGKLHNLTEVQARLLTELLGGELKGVARRLSGKDVNESFSVLVAGLGNAELTVDAIGPQTVKLLTATRHLRKYEQELYRDLECVAISAIAPGVLGQTGIETLELLRGIAEYVKPDVVLVVDALAARSCQRLTSTVQISDAGICPGSGVGNHRKAITKESLGIPVISLGVPTVVDSSTLVYDALEQAGIREICEPLKEVLKRGKSFFVSPKESDLITKRISELLACSIGVAFGGVLQVSLS